MAYTSINSSEIESGQPASSTTMSKVKGNLDDHETRLQSIEGGAGTTYPPLIFRVSGYYSALGSVNDLIKTTTNFAMLITGVRLLIDKAGTGGITQIDIKYKRGAGAYTSILTTQPSVDYSAGNDAISTNAVIDPANNTLQAGDILRLDLTSVQTNGSGLIVRVDYMRA